MGVYFRKNYFSIVDNKKVINNNDSFRNYVGMNSFQLGMNSFQHNYTPFYIGMNSFQNRNQTN